jgi:RNA polymerase sigma-70 factor (ECF subfamily)
MTTFLYPVVKHLALAARRKRLRMSGDEVALYSAADRPAAPDLGAARAELAGVVSGLPETHREVLLMRFVDAMSLEEIATALEIPVGTVKSRLHNAIAVLRKDPKTRAYFDP